MLVSLAQNFADVILQRALRHVERRCYVDVRGQDPVVDSISLAPCKQGWREPHVVEPTALDHLRCAAMGCLGPLSGTATGAAA